MLIYCIYRRDPQTHPENYEWKSENKNLQIYFAQYLFRFFQLAATKKE